MREILFDQLTPDQLHSYCLVLEAYYLPYIAETTGLGGRIWVEADIFPSALDLVQRYIRENPENSEAGATPPIQGQKTYSAVWVGLVLIVAHIIVQSSGETQQVVRAYGASAAKILTGEVYRATTALMLHADVTHLAGNLAGIALLGSLVAYLCGPGLGWLMILLSGISGNLINALYYQHGHMSIGASTAVFGALGFLVALQFGLKWKSRHRDQRKRAWLALGGGLALLGFLGTSEHSDLMAHLFGLLSGIGLGVLYALVFRPRIQEKHQVYCMAATIAITALAWLRP